jgi:hypothetical protein
MIDWFLEERIKLIALLCVWTLCVCALCVCALCVCVLCVCALCVCALCVCVLCVCALYFAHYVFSHCVIYMYYYSMYFNDISTWTCFCKTESMLYWRSTANFPAKKNLRVLTNATAGSDAITACFWACAPRAPRREILTDDRRWRKIVTWLRLSSCK